ncbi:MAG: hypothetical protein JRH11_00880 [Deltaproteobacteria bacterium]|nr:hypothetical protein [Deltaproteobacteria bacterium]
MHLSFIATWVLPVLLVLASACGSKSGLLSDDRAPVPVEDASRPPDGGFDTFPCSWSYGQPLDLGPAMPGATLGGAVHGLADVAWTQTGLATPTDSGISRLVSLTDPPSVVGTVPVAGAVPVHGMVDGWTVLASDCSLSFFDDGGSPLRLFIAPVNTPPCVFDSLDTTAIDVSAAGAPGRYSSATRMSTRGRVVHDVASTSPLGRGPRDLRTVVSADGSLVARFALDESAVVTGILTRVSGELLWEGLVGRTDGRFAVSLDRLRDAAVVLLIHLDGATLVRLPFDASGLVVQPLADIRGVIGGADNAVVTNETEALVPLADGRVAVQPLSGTELRFLPAPPEGEVIDLRILLAPGESRGGLLYRYLDAAGTDRLAFRTLTCNR